MFLNLFATGCLAVKHPVNRGNMGKNAGDASPFWPRFTRCCKARQQVAQQVCLLNYSGHLRLDGGTIASKLCTLYCQYFEGEEA